MSVMCITQKHKECQKEKGQNNLKPRTRKINLSFMREIHIFYSCLDMTHQYSFLHIGKGAAPVLPSFLLKSLSCSLTNHDEIWLYSYITSCAHSRHIVHTDSRITIMVLLNKFLYINQDAIGLAFIACFHGHATQPLKNTASFHHKVDAARIIITIL